MCISFTVTHKRSAVVEERRENPREKNILENIIFIYSICSEDHAIEDKKLLHFILAQFQPDNHHECQLEGQLKFK